MPGARPQSLTAALNGALGAIASTKAGVKQAAAEQYAEPAGQGPADATAPAPAGKSAP